ncbi:DUF5810 domain-containing protein [Halapricum desulfuricans]|nr:DUF5810 domain-containing protein [Halapricum desulfuricans]
MAYLCPVCAEPQADAEHLANHMAFTALIRGTDHEEWLDEHTPNWGEDDDEALAARLRDIDAVEETDHPIDEVDTGDRGHANRQNPGIDRRAVGDGETLDDEARAILEDARELTRRMDESDGETE